MKTDHNHIATTSTSSVARNQLLKQVYLWMCGGLALTAVISFGVVSTPGILSFFVSNKIVFYGLLIAEVALVAFLSGLIKRISEPVAIGLFLGYSTLNGLTLSVVLAVYTSSSIVSTLVITSIMFGSMSLYGYTTKKDLSSWGSFLFMGLIGLIVASLVNIFLKSSLLLWVVSAVGVLVFTGLAAHDTWKIAKLADEGQVGRKSAIMGALILYLDFINLALMLLRFTGVAKTK